MAEGAASQAPAAAARTVALIADRLRPGGVLHVATDHADTPSRSPRPATPNRGCAESTGRPDCPISVARPMTKYETKARDAGSAVTELLWEKLPMSLTDETSDARRGHAAAVGADRRRPRASCWSGTLPTSTWALVPSSAAGRPPHTGLASTRWAVGCCRRTAELSAGRERTSSVEPEATVFTNIAPGSADVVRPWVEALRNVGFAVFAKPKIDEDSDVDVDMLNHIALRRSEGLAGLLVASADGQAFRQPLEDIARAGTPVQVLGFREHASWALASDTLEFVDLEDIPGVFREPLPRIGLDSLPEQGAWLQPFRPLSSLLTSRV